MARRKRESAGAPLKWEDVPEIPKEEQPYPLPGGWKWVNASDVFSIVYGKGLPTKKLLNEGYPVFGANGQIGFYDEYMYEEPQALMSCRGAYSGVMNLSLPNSFVTNNSLVISGKKHHIEPELICFLFDSLDKSGLISGSAQPQVTIQSFENLILPFPPLSEHKLIVKRIKSLFSKLDEAAEKVRVLIDSHAARKQAILHQAFRGELTRDAEIPTEEPYKDISEIPKEEQPYPLPEGWKWVKGERIFSAGGTAVPSGDYFDYIDIDSIDNTTQLVKSSKRIKVKDAPSRARRKLSEGDTLFSLVRPYLRNIGYIDKNLSRCIASTGFYVCHPTKYVNSRYLYWLMTSNYVVSGLNQYMKGDNSPAIKARDIEDFLYPLPPREIQRRIVEIIEPIFSKSEAFNVLASITVKKISQLKKTILTQFFFGKI